ncbi:tripartite tricarboxylate transporter substrate-binding protein [Hydrogenophaga defluvii]|uniref:Tripartite tricarboxylate transporter substrate-binding protein n=1 Tax=Hydrogenophaga defluvii TaxID=249410 RepID=A0ABW2S9Z3_9BURK
MNHFGTFARLAAAALLAMANAAHAQTPPATVKILVGFPAGGAPDAVARALAEELRQTANVTVVVENKPGASGKIAIDSLLSAPGDGDTVAVIPASVLALVPQTVKAAKYDSVRDFSTLGSVAEYGFGVAAGPASKATTLAAYKTWAQANAPQSAFATPGNGTPQHFLGAQLEKALGIALTHVPYRGGAAAVGDVIGGQVPLLITTEQLLVPHEGQGKLKTLFITSKERNPKLPNVPTARELGMPQLESVDWFGVFGKAGMTPAKVTQWRAQLDKVLASTRYQDAMKHMGYTVPSKQPDDFPKLLASERAAWAERVKLSGFSAE